MGGCFGKVRVVDRKLKSHLEWPYTQRRIRRGKLDSKFILAARMDFQTNFRFHIHTVDIQRSEAHPAP